MVWRSDVFSFEQLESEGANLTSEYTCLIGNRNAREKVWC